MDLGSIFEKIKSNLWLLPEAKFDGLTKDNKYMPSLAYLAVCLLIAIPIDIIVRLVMNLEPTLMTGAEIVGLIIGAIIGMILAIPLFYLYYLVIHVIVRILGGTAPYIKTIQAAIYGSTLLLILSGVPLIGIVAGFVALANVVLGIKRVHKLSLLKAILAVVVIPVLIAIVLAMAVIGYLMPVQVV